MTRPNFLLSRAKPAQIPKDVFISAMTNEGLHKDNVKGRVVEQSPYIPTAVDILESVAENGSLNLFRFL